MPVASSNPETENYYLTQAALGTYVASQLAGGPPLDPGDLSTTYEALQAFAVEIATESAAAAVGFAVDYYDEFRSAQGVRDSFRTPIIDPPTLQVIERQFELGVADLRAAADVVADELYLAELTLQMQAEVEGMMQAAVADAGRAQILGAVWEDPVATGWVRVTRTDACSFCRMLAMRGPVYSELSVKFRAHTVTNGRGGVCQCTAEPVIRDSHEATAQARADAALWAQVESEGFRGTDARNEFRRRVEGRADGARRPRKDGTRLGNKSPVEVQGQRLGFDHLTPAQLQHHLTVLEAMPATKFKATQVARIRSRLAALGSSAQPA